MTYLTGADLKMYMWAAEANNQKLLTINYGRQRGHTTSMIEVLEPGDGVISCTTSHAKHTATSIDRVRGDGFSKQLHIMSIRQVDHLLRGAHCNPSRWFITDGAPALAYNRNIQQVIDMIMISCRPTLIVMLGE